MVFSIFTNMDDISDKADIKVFVDDFYSKVRIDPLIGPVFASIIPSDNWSPHLERMYSFWNTVLFGQADYRGNPFSKHAKLPIKQVHFDRWIELLIETLNNSFEGKKTEEVKTRAIKMGKLFQSKLEHIQGNNSFKNLF